MTPLYNAAYRLQEQRNFKGAIQFFEQALDQSSSAMDRMVIKYAMANCIWESAGLEMEGKVYALVPGNLAAAEAAQKLWEDIVNIYHKEVKESAAELARWPFRGGSAHEMCKDAIASSLRAFSAIDRVKKEGHQ